MKQSQVLNMIIAIISFFAFSCLFVLSSASAGVLYGISNNGSGTSVFGTINTSTGVLTSINSALTGDALFASTYDPATNLYYAVLEEDTGSTIDQRFMVINASDGSLITDVKDPQRLRSIEYDPTSGILYGITNDGSGTSVFGTINTSTGVLTSINSALTGDALFASTYDPATNLYYAVLEEDTGSTIDQRFMVINASDGSLITDVKDPQRLRSIELVSVPLPSTGWLFTAGMLSLVRVIKRKKVVLGSTNC